MPTPSTSSGITPIAGSSGNTLIDAMLFARFGTPAKWGGAQGTGPTLTFSFVSPGAAFGTNYNVVPAAIQVVPDVVQTSFREALKAWAAITNVQFLEIAETATEVGDIRLGVVSAFPGNIPSSTTAYSGTPSTSPAAGDVWVSAGVLSGPDAWNWGPGGNGARVLMHELGHAVFNLGDVSAEPGLDGAVLPASLNYYVNTLMTYSNGPGSTVGDTPVFGRLDSYPKTPMVLDVLAAQWLYGANPNFHAGDDVYEFQPGQAYFMTIVDAGGTDTLSIAGALKGGRLDLRPGQMSDVGSTITGVAGAGDPPLSYTQTVGLAYSAIIENATGGAGDDTLIGNDVANRFTGNGGDDTIDGGAGSNVSVYSGSARHYTITAVASSASLTVQDRTDLDGTDTLWNIQTLAFADASVDSSSLVKAASLAAQQVASVTDIYIASFNRAPDSLGLVYWAGRLKDGMTLEAIAKSFFVQPETAAKYPASTTNESFVTTVYGNVLGRAPDADGLTYWTRELANENFSRDKFLLAILNGARANPGATLDIANLNNKVTVGEYFALAKGLSNGTWSQQVMADVTSADSTVAAARAIADTFAASAEAPGAGELVVRILGIVA